MRKSHQLIRFVAIRYKGSRCDGDVVDIMETWSYGKRVAPRTESIGELTTADNRLTDEDATGG